MVLPVYANPFATVPANSWVYDSFYDLAKSGLITGVPKGKFSDDGYLTRYEAALLVARILGNIDKVGITTTSAVTPANMLEIERLTGEYKKELLFLGMTVEDIEEQLDLIEQTIATMSGRIRIVNTEDKARRGSIIWSGTSSSVYQSKEKLDRTQNSNFYNVITLDGRAQVASNVRIETGLFLSSYAGGYPSIVNSGTGRVEMVADRYLQPRTQNNYFVTTFNIPSFGNLSTRIGYTDGLYVSSFTISQYLSQPAPWYDVYRQGSRYRYRNLYMVDSTINQSSIRTSLRFLWGRIINWNSIWFLRSEGRLGGYPRFNYALSYLRDVDDKEVYMRANPTVTDFAHDNHVLSAWVGGRFERKLDYETEFAISTWERDYTAPPGPVLGVASETRLEYQLANIPIIGSMPLKCQIQYIHPNFVSVPSKVLGTNIIGPSSTYAIYGHTAYYNILAPIEQFANNRQGLSLGTDLNFSRLGPLWRGFRINILGEALTEISPSLVYFGAPEIKATEKQDFNNYKLEIEYPISNIFGKKCPINLKYVYTGYKVQRGGELVPDPNNEIPSEILGLARQDFKLNVGITHWSLNTSIGSLGLTWNRLFGKYRTENALFNLPEKGYYLTGEPYMQRLDDYDSNGLLVTYYFIPGRMWVTIEAEKVRGELLTYNPENQAVVSRTQRDETNVTVTLSSRF